MLKALFFRYLLPILLVLIFFRLFTRSRLLEKLKRKIRFEYLFKKFLLALVLAGVLIFGADYLLRQMAPDDREYPAQMQGGRSGRLPVPIHGRRR